MGSFYGSIQIRTDERESVLRAVEAIAAGRERRFLCGPVLSGWVGVYPDQSGQSSSDGDATAARMATENPGWGAPRIHGELPMLGFVISERAVSHYLPRRRKRGLMRSCAGSPFCATTATRSPAWTSSSSRRSPFASFAAGSRTIPSRTRQAGRPRPSVPPCKFGGLPHSAAPSKLRNKSAERNASIDASRSSKFPLTRMQTSSSSST